jgi:sporulation protein YhbH
MGNDPTSFIERADGEKRWYDLFSRGARDWLRHNDKVSEAVREKLPELISDVDVLGPKSAGTVRVPVRFLEHYRFRLRDDARTQGVGQGQGKPGDELVAPGRAGGGEKGEGGNADGGYEFVLEFKVDDIVDWLWEELQLPNLERKQGRLQDQDYVREGWNRTGVRSRLDRRRSMKEALKRRARTADGPAFTDDDLRYRQLVVRKQPSTEAVVFFAMDVSSSMTEQDRRLAKTFFFWVVQGLRRQYTRIEPVFVAHTVEAWEFAESEFFQVTGSGGTMASTAFSKVQEIIDHRFDPGRFNVYLFYSSDGANFAEDAGRAETALHKLCDLASFVGYVETQAGRQMVHRSEMQKIVDNLKSHDARIGSYALRDPDSVWRAIKGFFTRQAEAAGAYTDG